MRGEVPILPPTIALGINIRENGHHDIAGIAAFGLIDNCAPFACYNVYTTMILEAFPMRMISVRALREQLGEVWKRLESSGEVVVTSNGNPIALITPTSERSLEDDLRAVRRARAAVALDAIQTASVNSGTTRLTNDDIEAEIHNRRDTPPVVVLDPNVFISALLKPDSIPATVVRLIVLGKVLIAHDARILREYREVAARPTFHFERLRVEAILDVFIHDGIPIVAPPLSVELPDPDDDAFLEIAIACGSNTSLITGNIRHFPPDVRRRCRVYSPQEWLDEWRVSQNRD